MLSRMALRVLTMLALLVLPATLNAAEFYLGGGLGNGVEAGSFRDGLEAGTRTLLRYQPRLIQLKNSPIV